MIGCARNSAPPSPGFFCDPAPPDIAGNWGSGSGDHMPAAVEWEITARETILISFNVVLSPTSGSVTRAAGTFDGAVIGYPMTEFTVEPRHYLQQSTLPFQIATHEIFLKIGG